MSGISTISKTYRTQTSAVLTVAYSTTSSENTDGTCTLDVKLNRCKSCEPARFTYELVPWALGTHIPIA